VPVTPAITLLGPQRRPVLDKVLASLAIPGPIASVTAGWQERESDDAELDALTGGRSVNLRLHARWMDVLLRDPEYAEAEREHRLMLDELRQLYLVRLDHALDALSTVAQRTDGHARTHDMAVADALDDVRRIDERHLARVDELHADFYAGWRLEERDAVAAHREEVRAVLGTVGCLAIAGGHVGDLLRVLHVFHVAPHLPERVIAWSAGAMALTNRVVLFHDRSAQGDAPTEVFDEGLDDLPGLVLLPHARRRLRTDDAARMARLAQRFAPATCLVLDDGVRLDVGPDGALPPQARVVCADGRIVEGSEA
jgi:hypothetical protein